MVILDLPADPYAAGTGDDGVRDAPSVGYGNLGLGVEPVPRSGLDDPFLVALCCALSAGVGLCVTGR